MKLSAIVLTKNEEINISGCLRGLSFCDEVIVIDDNTTDGTIKIAEYLGAKVCKRNLNEDFANQRNFGLDIARNNWVLFVDADERITEKLKKEIISLLKEDNGFNGFYIPRKDSIWGKTLTYGETAKIKLLRLGKKNAGRWKRKVHEYWEIQGKIGELKNHLLHYPHQNLTEFLDHINKYSTVHAKENLKEAKKSTIIKILLYPIIKFIRNYFIKSGFIDKEAGLNVSLMMSLHSFLAWSKLWILQKNE